MEKERIKQAITELLATVDPGGPGLGLGKIADKFFFESTWEPRLSEPMGKVQYAKFVAVMVHRIRGEESCVREVHRFAALLSTERNHDFMRPAVPLIPELRYDIPQVPGRWQMALLVSLIAKVLRDRRPEYSYTAKDKENKKESAEEKAKERTSDNGLQKDEHDQIKLLLCGPGGGAGGGPRIDRFVRSFAEMGYSQAGTSSLEESKRKAQGLGQSFKRGSEGLPMNPWLRPKEPSIRPSGAASFSSNATFTSIPKPSGARERDSPPQELLSEVDNSPVIMSLKDETADSWMDCSPEKAGVSSNGKQSGFKEVLRN